MGRLADMGGQAADKLGDVAEKAPNVMNQPISSMGGFGKALDVSGDVTAKAARTVPDWQKALGAGIAKGGQAYDEQNRPRGGGAVSFNYQQAPISSDYFRPVQAQQPYPQPQSYNPFYGG